MSSLLFLQIAIINISQTVNGWGQYPTSAAFYSALGLKAPYNKCWMHKDVVQKLELWKSLRACAMVY